jgi:uncharacterized damage-inducible protein DinB
LHPVTAHLARSIEQIREDIASALHDLNSDELWERPNGCASAGFHAKHLAGSTLRLCTYLAGGDLTEEQLAEFSREQEPGASGAALLALVEIALERYELLVRQLPPEDFASVRYVGRKRLPVTAVGLAIHIAEHGQRHTGQAISIAKIVCRRQRD